MTHLFIGLGVTVALILAAKFVSDALKKNRG
ncbi:hypothetical protein HGI09_43580 [Streptomyces collinus]|nr:hypothetical protein HGI10_20530 [Streptomyces collinus]UJA16988.1 hypothetical protein HGI09_43580 [Streptomyces collinus]